MELDEKLSEVVGAFIGDGCISRYQEGKRIRTVVLFTGNWKNDFSYYVETIIPTIRKAFGGKRKFYHRKEDNTIRYVLCDRKIIRFFLDLGMPIGKKGDRITIPAGIDGDNRLAISCIRGIFNTDGSVYRRYSKAYGSHTKAYRNYAVIQFKMESKIVIRWVKRILEINGITVNKMTTVQNCSVIRITNQESVKRFAKEIGFTHTYHMGRFLDIVHGK